MKRFVSTGLLLLVGLAQQGGARAADSCGDLIIVLDRSGSMAGCKVGGKLKETLAKAAIKSVTDMFPAVPMGLAVFPDTLNSCAHEAACNMAKIVVPVQSGGAAMVTKWLSSMPTSCGGTPTGDSMVVVQNYTWPASEMNYTHYVLLITDGQPTCQDGINGSLPDGSGGCTPPASPTAMCDGTGSCECKNPTKVYGAIKTLFDKGVHTFIVGFEGAGMPTDLMGKACGPDPSKPFNPDTLNMMADLGGEPQDPPAATKYYSAVDEASINAALTKILGKISGGTVGGCVKGGGGSGGSGAGGSGSGGSGSGGSGSGGSGSGGAGSGGSGSGGTGGDNGGQGGDGQGGTGGDNTGGHHAATSGASCICALPGGRGGDAPTGLLALAPLALLALSFRARRRTR